MIKREAASMIKGKVQKVPKAQKEISNASAHE